MAAPLAGVALSVVLWWQTRFLDDVAQEGQLGPAFWPRLVVVGLGVASLAKLLVGISRTRPVDDDGAVRTAISTPRLVAAIATILLYVALAPAVGFAFATIAFAAAFMALGGTRSVVAIVTTAVGSTVAVLYLFIKLVYLPMPKGVGALEHVTLVLYRLLGIF